MPDRPRILQACSPCGSPTSRRSPTRDPGLAPSTLTDPRPRASPGAYFRSAVAAAHRAPEPGALTGRRTTPRRHKLRRRSSRRQLPPTKPIARPSQTPTLARYHDHTSEPTPLRKPTPAPTAMALAVTAGQPHPPRILRGSPPFCPEPRSRCPAHRFSYLCASSEEPRTGDPPQVPAPSPSSSRTTSPRTRRRDFPRRLPPDTDAPTQFPEL